MKEEGSNVALTKCFFCGEDNNILIHKRFGDISDLDKKVVDMSPCPRCEALMKKGIMLIMIDLSRSGDGWDKEKIPNPYRTGDILVLTEEGVNKVFSCFDNDGGKEFALKNRWVFFEREAAVALGLLEE